MPQRTPRFEKGHALSHRDLNALSEAITEQERGDFQRAKRRRSPDYVCKIVAFGPGGEPDFPDSRYWVRQVRLQTGIPPLNAIPSGMQEIAFGTSTPIWAEAINLSEAIGGTHSLAINTVVRIFEARDWAGQTHFMFTAESGAGGGSEEVVISKVVRCDDPWDAQETSTCLALPGVPPNNDHLRCYRIDLDGTPVIVEPYLPVFPNWPHTISEFSPVAWNPTDPNQPVFQVFAGSDRGGWVMSFGQGEKWIDPPTNVCGEEITGACCNLGDCLGTTTQADCSGDTWLEGLSCNPGEPCPEGSGTGACCDGGTCVDDVPAADCTNYLGDGSTCSGFGGVCPATGACCCPQGSGCYNEKIGGDVTCWANATEQQCIDGGGAWQGANTTCAGSPCAGGVSGACCLPGLVCVQAADDLDCGLQGGAFMGSGTDCDPNPCAGLCKNPTPPLGPCCQQQQGAGCIGGLDLTSEDCCIIVGGRWLGEGPTCADC